MEEMNYHFELAKKEDAESIYATMKAVYDAMDNKSLYVCDELSFVKAHIEKEGFIVKASDINNEIVACLIIRFPKLAYDNLGLEVGLDKEDLVKVVHMESAVVLPSHRGQHLMDQMLDFAEMHIDSDEYRYYMATVSPDNPSSYVFLERRGYVLAKTTKKYGGLMRRIYVRKDSKNEKMD